MVSAEGVRTSHIPRRPTRRPTSSHLIAQTGNSPSLRHIPSITPLHRTRVRPRLLAPSSPQEQRRADRDTRYDDYRRDHYASNGAWGGRVGCIVWWGRWATCGDVRWKDGLRVGGDEGHAVVIAWSRVVR